MCIITVLFLCYIHQIYLLTFIARICYYIYMRYVISILHTILLMPAIREAPRNQRQAPEGENRAVEEPQESPEQEVSEPRETRK